MTRRSGPFIGDDNDPEPDPEPDLPDPSYKQPERDPDLPWWDNGEKIASIMATGTMLLLLMLAATIVMAACVRLWHVITGG